MTRAGKAVGKLMALSAVAVPLFSSAVYADTKIFGNLHLSVDWADADDGKDSSAYVSSNTSILGFQGQEDIGGGLKGVWQIAQVISIDEGSGQFATFNSYVGLAGGWGTLIAGKHDDPFKNFNDRLNPFAATIGDDRTIMGTQADVSPTSPGKDTFNFRATNIVQYTSPRLSGFLVKAAYSAGYNNNEAPDNDNDATSASAEYENGPFMLGIAYSDNKALDATGLRIGGKASFGPATVGGVYEQLDSDTKASFDRDAWTLWARYNFGSNFVQALYSQADDYEGVSDSGAELWTVGLWHSLSKRTQLYGMYAALDNDANSRRGLARWGHGDHFVPAAGGDPSGFSVGILHKF